MDRLNWLKEMRQQVEERYDTLWAPQYGETLGLYPNATHIRYIQKFLDLLPTRAAILDAACGAGRYISEFLNAGHSVIGIDQSQGMLDRATDRFPGIQTMRVGLQEMSFHEAFDGAVCMDAMEHVCPEDWPVVLANFQRALKTRGYFYCTVETYGEQEIKGFSSD